MDSERDQLLMWTIFGTLMVLGFLAGAARGWLPRAPRVAIIETVAGFAALLAVTIAWVVACPGCTSHVSYDSSRAIDLMAAVLWGGTFTLAILLFVRLGSLLHELAVWLRARA